MLLYFKAHPKYQLTNPLQHFLAREVPSLKEKAITRLCENWEFRPKLSLEFVGSSVAFGKLRKEDLFLSTAAFEVAKW